MALRMKNRNNYLGVSHGAAAQSDVNRPHSLKIGEKSTGFIFDDFSSEILCENCALKEVRPGSAAHTI